MKSVIIAIRPQWCEKIASGEKTIEVRKSAPKEVPFKAYIYATRPKKFYKCGAVSTSDELLWLSNGKVEMGDGFKFWANGDEYQCLNGRIIGEFICDGIAEFEGEFHDDGSTEELRRVWYDEDDGERDAELFAENGEQNYLCTASCLTWNELKKYIGIGYHTFYGWHISDLKIYDKPRALSEFYYCCKEMKANEPRAGKYVSLSCYACRHNALKRTEDYSEYNNMLGYICKRNITRPPQSWQYVEEVEQTI